MLLTYQQLHHLAARKYELGGSRSALRSIDQQLLSIEDVFEDSIICGMMDDCRYQETLADTFSGCRTGAASALQPSTLLPFRLAPKVLSIDRD